MLALLLAGCGGPAAEQDRGRPTPTAANWFAACPRPTGAAPAGSALPAVTLPCFTGGSRVPLNRAFGRPVVINLWSSWCAPCRNELPQIQRYADRSAGKVLVLTVDTQDRRDAGLSFAQDAKVKLPTLYDEPGALLKGVGRTALPVTLLVDAGGRLVYTYNARALTADELAALVSQHLQV